MKLKHKLKSVLLVDDDEVTNYIHQIVIKQAGFAESVESVMSGYEALDFLKSKADDQSLIPDFIFLDINMPGMNGWEFLNEYERLPQEMQGSVIIVMVTTTLSPDDSEAAKNINAISGFKDKPLTEEMLLSLVEEYFPEYLNE